MRVRMRYRVSMRDGVPERERFPPGAELVDREAVHGLQMRVLAARRGNVRVRVFREQVRRCWEVMRRRRRGNVRGPVGVHVYWGTGTEAHSRRRGAECGVAFVEGRRGAFGAGGGDGDSVGVVGGGYGVALEVVDEARLGGDGNVDCVEEEAVCMIETLRRVKDSGRRPLRERRSRE